MAEVQRMLPGSGLAMDVTWLVKEMRRVPGSPNIEVHGDSVIRARVVDQQGRTFLGIDQTDVTPFVKIAVPKPGGWLGAHSGDVGAQEGHLRTGSPDPSKAIETTRTS